MLIIAVVLIDPNDALISPVPTAGFNVFPLPLSWCMVTGTISLLPHTLQCTLLSYKLHAKNVLSLRFCPRRARDLLDPVHLPVLRPDLDPVRMRSTRREDLLDSSGGQPARALVLLGFYLHLQSNPQFAPAGWRCHAQRRMLC